MLCAASAALTCAPCPLSTQSSASCVPSSVTSSRSSRSSSSSNSSSRVRSSRRRPCSSPSCSLGHDRSCSPPSVYTLQQPLWMAGWQGWGCIQRTGAACVHPAGRFVRCALSRQVWQVCTQQAGRCVPGENGCASGDTGACIVAFELYGYAMWWSTDCIKRMCCDSKSTLHGLACCLGCEEDWSCPDEYWAMC